MRSILAVVVMLMSCKPAPPAVPGLREISITERGFEPARVEAKAGEKVVLRFTRKAKESCADAVDIQGDPVRHALPLDVPVEVKVTAPPSGQLAFACPMKMYKGAIAVVPN